MICYATTVNMFGTVRICVCVGTVRMCVCVLGLFECVCVCMHSVCACELRGVVGQKCMCVVVRYIFLQLYCFLTFL